MEGNCYQYFQRIFFTEDFQKTRELGIGICREMERKKKNYFSSIESNVWELYNNKLYYELFTFIIDDANRDFIYYDDYDFLCRLMVNCYENGNMADLKLLDVIVEKYSLYNVDDNYELFRTLNNLIIRDRNNRNNKNIKTIHKMIESFGVPELEVENYIKNLVNKFRSID